MSEERRSVGVAGTLAAGAVVGAVEVVALHRWFAGTLAERLTDRMRTLDSLLD